MRRATWGKKKKLLVGNWYRKTEKGDQNLV